MHLQKSSSYSNSACRFVMWCLISAHNATLMTNGERVMSVKGLPTNSKVRNYYVLTYLLHGAESFFRSKLGLQLVKKFPTFYGTRNFITVLASARHLSPSWANSIQSPQPPPTSWRSILVLSSHLRLGLPNIYKKVKQSRYRPGVAQRVPGS